MPTNRVTLRSEDVSEILEANPHWLVRRGSMIILLILLLSLLSSTLVQYPETVSAAATIVTEHPPVAIVANSPGRLDALWVQDGEKVIPGTVLAAIGTQADISKILNLKTLVARLDDLLDTGFQETQPSSDAFMDVGEVQGAATALRESLDRLREHRANDDIRHRLNLLLQEIEHRQELEKALSAQSELLAAISAQALSELQADSILFKRGHTSTLALEQAHSKWLETQHDLKSAEITIAESAIQTTTTEREWVHLREQRQAQHQDLLQRTRVAAGTLANEIAAWETEHLLRTPIEGIVSFGETAFAGQFVQQGTEVMIVSPLDGHYVARARLPQTRSGRVLVGQTVRLRLDSYPYTEFGDVVGSVRSISPVSRDSIILIQVALPNGSTTSFGKKLRFRQGMQGIAEIVTDDTRLIEKMFAQLLYFLRDTRQPD